MFSNLVISLLHPTLSFNLSWVATGRRNLLQRTEKVGCLQERAFNDPFECNHSLASRQRVVKSVSKVFTTWNTFQQDHRTVDLVRSGVQNNPFVQSRFKGPRLECFENPSPLQQACWHTACQHRAGNVPDHS